MCPGLGESLQLLRATIPTTVSIVQDLAKDYGLIQADATQIHHTGIGLSIVLGIVKSHKGFLQVDSAPGEGATFAIYFPIPENTAADKQAEIPGQHKEGNEQILLVDDEETPAVLGCRMLEQLGYAVSVKLSNVDALATFKANSAAFDGHNRPEHAEDVRRRVGPCSC